MPVSLYGAIVFPEHHAFPAGYDGRGNYTAAHASFAEDDGKTRRALATSRRRLRERRSWSNYHRKACRRFFNRRPRASGSGRCAARNAAVSHDGLPLLRPIFAGSSVLLGEQRTESSASRPDVLPDPIPLCRVSNTGPSSGGHRILAQQDTTRIAVRCVILVTERASHRRT